MNRSKKSAFSCSFCPNCFVNEINLRRHIKKFHKEIKKEPKVAGKQKIARLPEVKSPERIETDETSNFQCSECKKQSTSKVLYNVHLATHIDECSRECSSCLLLYNTSDELEAHLERHSDEPVYCCDMCHKSFFHLDGLVQHKLTHSFRRPYKCYRCEETFDDGTTRFYHVAKCHLLWCFQCEIAFLELGLYQKHCQDQHSFHTVDEDIQSRINIVEGCSNASYSEKYQQVFPTSPLCDSNIGLEPYIKIGNSNDPCGTIVFQNALAGPFDFLSTSDVPLPLNMDINSILNSPCILTNFNCQDIPEFDINSSQYSDWLCHLIDQCRSTKYPFEQAFYMKVLSANAKIIEAITNPSQSLGDKKKYDFYVKNYDILSNVIEEHLKAIKKTYHRLD